MIGQRAGHTIHLETEEVIRIKKKKNLIVFPSEKAGLQKLHKLLV